MTSDVAINICVADWLRLWLGRASEYRGPMRTHAFQADESCVRAVVRLDPADVYGIGLANMTFIKKCRSLDNRSLNFQP